MAGPNASRAKRGPLPSISANADTRARSGVSSSGPEAPTTKLRPYSLESWRDLRPRGRSVMLLRKSSVRHSRQRAHTGQTAGTSFASYRSMLVVDRPIPPNLHVFIGNTSKSADIARVMVGHDVAGQGKRSGHGRKSVASAWAHGRRPRRRRRSPGTG